MSPAYVSGDANSNGRIDLTETWIYEASGTAITGNYTNTGTANGSYTDSSSHARTVTATDNDSYFGANPQLSLTKSANPTIYSYPGQVIVYTFVVKNTGNVTLSGPFNVTDDKLGTFQCGTATSLAPGASITCTKSYTIQASDIAAANVTSLPTALPATAAYGAWPQGTKSTINITLSGLDPASGVPNGVYAGWCIQAPVTGQLHNQPATLYSSIGGQLPADAAGLPWNKINYVLNHKIRAAYKSDVEFHQDIQTAIWALLGDTPYWGVNEEARQMITEANAHPDYVPGNGDVVAVLVYSDGMSKANPNSSIQEVIVEMTARSITNKATATGKFGTTPVTSNQAQATINQVPPTGKIAPTNTTCQQFRDGTSGDLLDEWYLVKSNKINSIAPGVFFYYSKITAPASSFTLQVRQSNTRSWRPDQDPGSRASDRLECKLHEAADGNGNV